MRAKAICVIKAFSGGVNSNKQKEKRLVFTTNFFYRRNVKSVFSISVTVI